MSSRPPGPSGGHSAGESSGVRGGAGAGGAEESTSRLGGCPEPACVLAEPEPGVGTLLLSGKQTNKH